MRNQQYVSVPRAAKMYGLSASTLHGLIDRGEIPAIRPVSQRRVRISDVDAHMQRCAEEPKARRLIGLSPEAAALLA
jgi:excisionase family DNA binding protein